MTPRWISLCCGLDATACRAMTGRFAPVPRIGGKRGYADGVLDILGTWPRRWLMVDADPAIVLFWEATFGGCLPAVAEVIRNAPLDGEALWKAWRDEPVPADPVERLARWVVLQKGNFSSRSVSWKNGRFAMAPGAGGFGWKNAPGGGEERPDCAIDKARDADRLDEWQGLAGFKTESGSRSGNWANQTTVDRKKVADAVAAFQGPGEALYLELNASSPIVNRGDLVTIDPPYRDTTGYRDGLHRDRVVELAEEAHERGARVVVHEAEPVIEGGPWRAVELRRTHGGKQRTWSKQQREVVTINFEPATAYPGAHKGRGAERTELAPIEGPLFE